MGTLKIGSASNRKGVTVEPSTVLFNGNNVKYIMKDTIKIWQKNHYLYKLGNEYTDITGGWEKTGYKINNESATNSGISKDTSTILINGSSGTGWTSIGTQKAINLNDYSKLIVEANITSINGGGALNITVSNSKQYTMSNELNYKLKSTGVQIAEIDISSLSSEYYISLACGRSAYAVGTVSRIYLIP